jgi:hypothetical protein
MGDRQLEFGFENRPQGKAMSRSRRRTGRAHWWFSRMRCVVNEARDWPLALRSRQVPGSVEPAAKAEDLT